MLPACEPTMLMAALLAAALLIPVDELPGALVGLLWLIRSWLLWAVACEWWLLDDIGTPCCWPMCKCVLSAELPPAGPALLTPLAAAPPETTMLWLFWNEVDVCVLMMLLRFDGTFEAPTWEFGATPLTTAAVAPEFMLFWPLWLLLFG